MFERSDFYFLNFSPSATFSYPSRTPFFVHPRKKKNAGVRNETEPKSDPSCDAIRNAKQKGKTTRALPVGENPARSPGLNVVCQVVADVIPSPRSHWLRGCSGGAAGARGARVPTPLARSVRTLRACVGSCRCLRSRAFRVANRGPRRFRFGDFDNGK